MGIPAARSILYGAFREIGEMGGSCHDSCSLRGEQHEQGSHAGGCTSPRSETYQIVPACGAPAAVAIVAWLLAVRRVPCASALSGVAVWRRRVASDCG
jgi:hypothetical protein